MAELVLSGVRKRYGASEVVRGVDLVVGDGEIVALLGASGSGKTTTLRLVAGLERPNAGRVSIGGQVVAEGQLFVPPERRNLAMVFQSYAIWPHLDVLGNVSFPLAGRPDARERALKALETVRLAGLEHRRSHELSGGQQQRVALARALAAEPRLLLLDEPLSNLDARLRATVRDEIRALVRRAGLTTVLVTHDQEEAFAIADRVALMEGGRIRQVGTPQALYDSPDDDVVARFFGLQELTGERKGDAVVVGGVAIPAHATSDAPTRGPCALGFRVEQAELADEGLEGQVASRVYLGSEVRCWVQLGSEQVLVRADAAVGATVHLRIRRGVAMRLPT